MDTSMSLHVQQVNTVAEAEALLQTVGATPAGIALMREKVVFRVILVENVSTKAANLLKQTFLSKGADAAVSCHTADLSAPTTSVLLFATLATYRRAVQTLRLQPWGLKELADGLAHRLQLE